MRQLCERALAAITPGAHSARVALRLARLAEVAGDRRVAATRYGEAWRWDPRCSEAALCQSRLARMAGDWLEADGILARFLEAHPDPTSASVAQVHLERGRLLSGPLEAFEDAIGAYQRALALVPGLAVARSALGGLLLHAPDRWREALALHREILAAAPDAPPRRCAPLVTLAERQGANRGRRRRPPRPRGPRPRLAPRSRPRPQRPSGSRSRPAHPLRLRRGRTPAPTRPPGPRRARPHPRDRTANRSGSPVHPEDLPTAEILAVEDELTAPHFSRQSGECAQGPLPLARRSLPRPGRQRRRRAIPRSPRPRARALDPPKGPADRRGDESRGDRSLRPRGLRSRAARPRRRRASSTAKAGRCARCCWP